VSEDFQDVKRRTKGKRQGRRQTRKGESRSLGECLNRQPHTPEEEQAPPEVPDQESGDRSEEEEEEVLERPDAIDDKEEEVEEEGDGIVQDDGEAWDRKRQATEEKIADFYEARLYLFDKGHDLYKNKKKQMSELAQLSQDLEGIYKHKFQIVTIFPVYIFMH